MKRSLIRIIMMKQNTVVRRRMTAATLRKNTAKLGAIPHCFKVKAGDRGEAGAQT